MNWLHGKKLLSLFPPQAWSLLGRVAVVGVVAYAAHYGATGWWGILYVVVGIYLYSYAIKGTRAVWLLVGTLLLIWTMATMTPLGSWWLVGLGAALGVLYGLLGATMHTMVGHKAWLSLVYYVLLVAGVSYYITLPLDSSWGKMALAFVGQYLLAKNYVGSVVEEWDKRTRVWVLVGSLLGAQIVWISLLLSAGALYPAALVLVHWVVLLELLQNYRKGILTRANATNSMAMFVGCWILIGLIAWISL